MNHNNQVSIVGSRKKGNCTCPLNSNALRRLQHPLPGAPTKVETFQSDLTQSQVSPLAVHQMTDFFKSVEVTKGPLPRRGDQTFLTIHAIWQPGVASGWAQDPSWTRMWRRYCHQKRLGSCDGLWLQKMLISLQVGKRLTATFSTSGATLC